ncbi:MAG TPA: radical SAM protein [Pseudobdellovibrionaceae bacterium]|nr:radical SAM protein [Pseudobdellovibrionaceae bacterium]
MTHPSSIESSSDYLCRFPFEKAEILANGDVHLCCAGWLPQVVGSVRDQSIAEVWNSPIANSIREKIGRGDFSSCRAELCPHLTSLQSGEPPAAWSPLKRRDLHLQAGHQRDLLQTSEFPREINCAFDATCNLSCPSCRPETVAYAAHSAEARWADRLVDEILDVLAKSPTQIQRLKLSGNGDPFASRAYRRLLRSLDAKTHPDLRITLHTNALLLTPERWAEIRAAHAMIDTVEVSIDAATSSTYRKLRRGGEFSQLMPRLAWLAKLRQGRSFRRFILSFVVQRENFREMAAFVDLGRQHQADVILFSQLNDWGSMSPEAFAAAAIHRPTHPEHAEFRALIESSSWRHASDVWLSNLPRASTH